MKNRLLSMLMIASCFGVANAQLIVDDKGRTAVGYEDTDTLKSMFSVNSEGKKNATAYIYSSNQYGLYMTSSGSNTYSKYGTYLHNSGLGISYNYGLYSVVAGTGGKRIGVMGTVTTNGYDYDYGVVGKIYPETTTNGAAVYGSTTSNIYNTLANISGLYAGYFHGDTRITGTLTAGSVVTSSDYRLKDNIRSLSSSDGCLGKLMSMNVVEYNNRQREYEVEEADLEDEFLEMDSTVSTMGLRDNKVCWYEEDSPIINNKHYGLIAQELREIYPDLVVESQDGFLAINYLEIIPLLIRSVQELNAKVELYENGNAPIKKAATRSVEEEEATAIDAVVTALYQNEPNPFTASTVIRCDVAEEVTKADLYIYNMNGEQIAEYAVAERGATSVTIDGGSLNAGMYLYALIADGKVIDTKRMILTK